MYIERRKMERRIEERKKNVWTLWGLLAEFEAEAESQLVLLDLSVSVDVAVTHQSFPELVQVFAEELERGQKTPDEWHWLISDQ